jgi:hypothetical protein
MIEEQGTPATVLITEPFQSIIASHAAKLGAPGYHTLVVPHPIYGKTDEELRRLITPIVDVALAQLLADVPPRTAPSA